MLNEECHDVSGKPAIDRLLRGAPDGVCGAMWRTSLAILDLSHLGKLPPKLEEL